MRSPSKGKVVGSIPAEALPFLFFYASYLFPFTFVVWSRGAMETRLPPKQKIVGSTPTGIAISPILTILSSIPSLYPLFFMPHSCRIIFAFSFLIM